MNVGTKTIKYIFFLLNWNTIFSITTKIHFYINYTMSLICQFLYQYHVMYKLLFLPKQLLAFQIMILFVYKASN